MKRPLFFGLALLTLAGCGLQNEVACTAIAAYGLNVTVVDDATGQQLCNATVTATEGTYAEPLTTFTSTAPCTYLGATERAGTYRIDVEAPGYADGTVADVVVDKDECHVIGEAVEVRLTKS